MNKIRSRPTITEASITNTTFELTVELLCSRAFPWGHAEQGREIKKLAKEIKFGSQNLLDNLFRDHLLPRMKGKQFDEEDYEKLRDHADLIWELYYLEFNRRGYGMSPRRITKMLEGHYRNIDVRIASGSPTVGLVSSEAMREVFLRTIEQICVEAFEFTSCRIEVNKPVTLKDLAQVQPSLLGHTTETKVVAAPSLEEIQKVTEPEEQRWSGTGA